MRRVIAIALGLTVALLALGVGWLSYRLNDRPDLAAYEEHVLAPAVGVRDGVRVTFLGVSTVLIDDGETAILTDGFFTRPGLVNMLVGAIAPDPDRIARHLDRAGIDRLAAVVDPFAGLGG